MITTEHKFTPGDMLGVLYGTLVATGLHVKLEPNVGQTGIVIGAWFTLPNGYRMSVQWGEPVHRSGLYSRVGRGQNEPGDEPDFEALACDGKGALVYPTSRWPKWREEGWGDSLSYAGVIELVQYIREVAALPPVAVKSPPVHFLGIDGGGTWCGADPQADGGSDVNHEHVTCETCLRGDL